MDEIGPVAVKSALIIVLRSRFSPLIILQMRLDGWLCSSGTSFLDYLQSYACWYSKSGK